ncbi:hypothetical protein [Hymenobacter sp. GOD-10R]|uniref:hypothetical protein n=1 Tax=Hymenobacter sp. GOD-10R TaxID=3093922 RepID=UPI002D77219F|nr:hypothetical protein [Hymenobacter sp. GOD-10R]WRQ27330.1 hypothetical protein SD425_19850 [Hymenobacter sp. GOD-10R]
MRLNFIPFLFLLTSPLLPAWAQSPSKYILDLRADKAKPIASDALYIAQVVDLRLNQNNIGWVQGGMYENRILANFRHDFKQELTSFAQAASPRKANAQPILMCVRELQVAEHAKQTQQTASAELVIDYLYQQNNGYHLIAHTADAVTTKRLYDITAYHEYNLTKVLNQSLAKLASINLEQMVATTPTMTWEEVLGSAISSQASYPIMVDSLLRPGVYLTFQEFRNNAPSLAGTIEVEQAPLQGNGWAASYQAIPHLRNADGRRTSVSNKVWGFCDGKQFYIRHDRAYFPLRRRADAFTFLGLAPPDWHNNQQQVVPAGSGAFMFVHAAPNLPMEYSLNMATGQVSEFVPSTAPMAAPADTTSIVVYRRPDAAPDQAVTILVDGQVVGTLRGNEYVVIPWTDKKKELALGARTAQETTYRFHPNFLAGNYLDCRLVSATQTAPRLRLMLAEEGAAHVAELTPAKE